MLYNKKSIAFLLGAGFSVPNGNLTVQKVNDELMRFDELNIDFVPDGRMVKIKNGYDSGIAENLYSIRYKFCMKLMKYFQRKYGRFDYEEFYDFIISRELDNKEYVALASEFVTDCTSYFVIIDGLDTVYDQMINYVLTNKHRDKVLPKEDKLCEKYIPFLDYIQNKSQDHMVNIHSLNHDLLFESFNDTPYISGKLSDGFIINDSKYYGIACNVQNDTSHFEKIAYYKDEYNTNIRLYKLHGSFNYVLFRKGNIIPDNYVKIQSNMSPTQLYKKTGRQDCEKCIYSLCADFLTGLKYKEKRYNEPLYFDKVFTHFKENLKEAEKLIIIGYGGKDEGINEMVKTCFDFKNKPVYILDPGIDNNENLKSFAIYLNAKIITGGIEDFDENTFE